MARKLCIVCEWREARRNLRCPTCAAYKAEKGVDRPEHLLVAEGIRELHRRLSA